VFDNRRTLNSVTGFPVLGVVSQVASVRMKRRERVELVAFASFGGLLILTYFVVVAAGGIHLPIVERLLG
jgi:hypothetical protein